MTRKTVPTCQNGTCPVHDWGVDHMTIEGSDGENAAPNLSLGWVGLASVLAQAAKEWHESAERKVNVCQDEYAKYEEQEHDNQPKVRARKSLANGTF